MTVSYDRSKKVYVSNIIVEGAWPTRLDAEAAELPADLVSKATELAGSLKVAVKAVRLVVNDKVEPDGRPDTYTVPSASHPELYHVVDLRNGGCDCEAANVGICCAHLTAALLVASEEQEMAEVYAQVVEEQRRALDNKSREELIDELFGPPVQVKDARGRVVFG